MPDTDLHYALEVLQAKRPVYDTFRAYDAGRQPIMFATQKFRQFYEQVMRRYRLNLCRSVVRQTARRLDIDAWDGDEAASEWWANDGLRLQNRLSREAVREGDAYLLTWPVETMSGPLRVNRLRADEAIVIYSDEDPDMPKYGVKTWLQRQPGTRSWDLRANIYYTDQVERYIVPHATQSLANMSQPGKVDLDHISPQPYNDDDAGDTIPYDGTLRAAGAEGLLPIQHFPCQPDDTPYGTSILADVVSVQDALNKHAIDILVTSEQYGLPLRAALGIEEVRTVDPETGAESSNTAVDYDPRMDYFLTLPGENSRLVSLPEADLTKLLEVKRACVQDATLVSSVPLMLLAEDSGSVPTGVALREIKAPLSEMVEDIQEDFTIPYRNVARLHGWDARPEWSSPFQMDVVELWELAQIKIDAGWPERQAIIETGLDPEFVDEVFAANVNGEQSVAEALVRAEREGRDPAELLR